MNARLLALPLLCALLLALGCLPGTEPTTAPTPEPTAPGRVGPVAKDDKQAQELLEKLVGVWKSAKHSGVFEETSMEFTRDGRFIGRMRDKGHAEQYFIFYRLDGAILTFDPSEANETPHPFRDEEVWEKTSMIEAVTADRLVLLVTIRKRYTPTEAQKIAKARQLPVEQILAEVRETRTPVEYIRVKDETYAGRGR